MNFSEILVIGVSSRALFDLEKGNEVFDKKGCLNAKASFFNRFLEESSSDFYKSALCS